MNKKIVIWIVIIILTVGLVYWLAKSAQKSEAGRPGEAVSLQGAQHVAVGAEHPKYNSNPPTSGWHYAAPANGGFYENELPDEQVLHNLEHGSIWISYKDIDEDTKIKLEDIGRRFSQSVIITPREKNDAKIALASWGRLQKLEQFDEEAIINFIKANKNKSPEPLAQ
ncbi:MAG: DUF3105 domain-containing protein [Patescibacteria group bacterium]